MAAYGPLWHSLTKNHYLNLKLSIYIHIYSNIPNIPPLTHLNFDKIFQKKGT